MVEFFQAHSIWFLLGLMFFPRITMLFFVTIPFGALAWVGWTLMPSLVVAIFATIHYWDTNPVLVIFAWIWFAMKYGGGGTAISRR